MVFVFRCCATPDPAAPPQKQKAVWWQRAGLLHGPQRNAGYTALWPSREPTTCAHITHTHTHTYRRACLHLHTSTNYTTICISTCKRTHSVRLQSAAALRSCYFRKPWGLNGCFHTVIDYSLVCADFTVIIEVHPMSWLSFNFRWHLQDSSLAIM